ncbi:MAG: transposase [Burkholderiales bacterium]
MARLPRSVVAGYPHFVIHRGLNGQGVFHDDVDSRTYRQALMQAARESGVAVHGYGLCRQEVRLLVTPSAAQSLSTMMQSVGRRYVRIFNLRHGLSGTPWEGRFRSTVIDAPDWFMRCLQYAESCAAGDLSGTEVVLFAADQHVSSAGHHLGLRIDDWISEHALFWAIGNTPFDREVAYRRVLSHPLAPNAIETIRNATLKGWALGSPAFAKSVHALTGRRHEPLARGRPATNSKTTRPGK